MAYRLITKNKISSYEYLIVDISNKLFQVKGNKEESDGIIFYFDFLVADTSEFKPDYDCECTQSGISDDLKTVNFHWAGSVEMFTYDVPYSDDDYKWRNLSSNFWNQDTTSLEQALTDALTKLLVDYDIMIDNEDCLIVRGIFNSYMKHGEQLPDSYTLSQEIYNYIKKKAVKGSPTIITV